MPEIIICTHCSKRTCLHDNVIKCSLCHNSYHIRCQKDNIQIGQNLDNWSCKNCNCQIFPFNNIESDDKYTEAITDNLTYNDCNLNELESLLLYNLDLEDEKIEEILQEIDPDENFYKTRQNLKPSQ